MYKINITIVSFFLYLVLAQSLCLAGDEVVISENTAFIGSSAFSWKVRGDNSVTRSKTEILALNHPEGKRLSGGTGFAIGAGIGALATSIATFCYDAFQLYGSSHCGSIFNVPAILFGAFVGGTTGYAFVVYSKNTMVGFRARF